MKDYISKLVDNICSQNDDETCNTLKDTSIRFFKLSPDEFTEIFLNKLDNDLNIYTYFFNIFNYLLHLDEFTSDIFKKICYKMFNSTLINVEDNEFAKYSSSFVYECSKKYNDVSLDIISNKFNKELDINVFMLHIIISSISRNSSIYLVENILNKICDAICNTQANEFYDSVIAVFLHVFQYVENKKSLSGCYLKVIDKLVAVAENLQSNVFTNNLLRFLSTIIVLMSRQENSRILIQYSETLGKFFSDLSTNHYYIMFLASTLFSSDLSDDKLREIAKDIKAKLIDYVESYHSKFKDCEDIDVMKTMPMVLNAFQSLYIIYGSKMVRNCIKKVNDYTGLCVLSSILSTKKVAQPDIEIIIPWLFEMTTKKTTRLVKYGILELYLYLLNYNNPGIESLTNTVLMHLAEIPDYCQDFENIIFPIIETNEISNSYFSNILDVAFCPKYIHISRLLFNIMSRTKVKKVSSLQNSDLIFRALFYCCSPYYSSEIIANILMVVGRLVSMSLIEEIGEKIKQKDCLMCSQRLVCKLIREVYGSSKLEWNKTVALLYKEICSLKLPNQKEIQSCFRSAYILFLTTFHSVNNFVDLEKSVIQSEIKKHESEYLGEALYFSISLSNINDKMPSIAEDGVRLIQSGSNAENKRFALIEYNSRVGKKVDLLDLHKSSDSYMALLISSRAQRRLLRRARYENPYNHYCLIDKLLEANDRSISKCAIQSFILLFKKEVPTIIGYLDKVCCKISHFFFVTKHDESIDNLYRELFGVVGNTALVNFIYVTLMQPGDDSLKLGIDLVYNFLSSLDDKTRFKTSFVSIFTACLVNSSYSKYALNLISQFFCYPSTDSIDFIQRFYQIKLSENHTRDFISSLYSMFASPHFFSDNAFMIFQSLLKMDVFREACLSSVSIFPAVLRKCTTNETFVKAAKVIYNFSPKEFIKYAVETSTQPIQSTIDLLSSMFSLVSGILISHSYNFPVSNSYLIHDIIVNVIVSIPGDLFTDECIFYLCYIISQTNQFKFQIKKIISKIKSKYKFIEQNYHLFNNMDDNDTNNILVTLFSSIKAEIYQIYPLQTHSPGGALIGFSTINSCTRPVLREMVSLQADGLGDIYVYILPRIISLPNKSYNIADIKKLIDYLSNQKSVTSLDLLFNWIPGEIVKEKISDILDCIFYHLLKAKPINSVYSLIKKLCDNSYSLDLPNFSQDAEVITIITLCHENRNILYVLLRYLKLSKISNLLNIISVDFFKELLPVLLQEVSIDSVKIVGNFINLQRCEITEKISYVIAAAAHCEIITDEFILDKIAKLLELNVLSIFDALITFPIPFIRTY